MTRPETVLPIFNENVRTVVLSTTFKRYPPVQDKRRRISFSTALRPPGPVVSWTTRTHKTHDPTDETRARRLQCRGTFREKFPSLLLFLFLDSLADRFTREDEANADFVFPSPLAVNTNEMSVVTTTPLKYYNFDALPTKMMLFNNGRTG